MSPGMSGKQTYEKIREIKPESKTIVVSGFSENEDVQDTLDAGAIMFIQKPYSMHQIAKAVSDSLLLK